jgi:hypothetical protein
MLKRFSLMTIALTLLLSFSLQAGDFKYVGVKKCKTCHKPKKIGAQYKVWKNGPHANGFETLKTDKAKEIAKKNKIEDPTTDPKCTACHTTMGGIKKEDLDKKSKMTMEEGVSCESCHGPGNKYKKKSIMKDHAKSLANGLIVPDEETCASCHNQKKNIYHDQKKFVYAEFVKKVSHPVPGK